MAEFLTAQQVRERLGISRAMLLRLEANNAIPGAIQRTAGGQRRYNPDALARAIQQNTPAKPDYKEYGDTGLSRWGGSVDQSAELTELKGERGYKLYREMRANDPVIAAIFFAIENSLKQTTARIRPFSESKADKDVATFVDECRTDMSFSWSDTMDFICQMLEMGTSPLEIVYKRRLGQHPQGYTADAGASQYNDGRVGWRKWAPRPLDTLSIGNEWVFGLHGSIEGINQSLPDSGESVEIDIEKLLLFRSTAAPANSPMGIPIHRAAYTSYFYSKNFQEIEGIGVERDLAGIPIIYMGNDTTKTGENSDYVLAKDLVVNLRNDEQAGIVVPYAKMGFGASEGQGMLVELLSAQNGRAQDVGGIIERYDKRKALSVLAQFIMLGMDKFGSFALSKTQNDLFALAISSWVQKIADVINMYAIPRLLNYNVFPGMKGYPTLAFSEVGIPDLAQMATFVNAMVGREVITPDAELERHLRQMARLPEPMIEVGKPKVKPKPVEESALLLRRIVLAIKELPSYSGMSDEQLTAMVDPIIQQMRLGIETETGIALPEIDANTVTDANNNVSQDVAEIMQQLNI